MNHLRPPRFNAKARKSSAGPSKRRRRDDDNDTIDPPDAVDPNAEIFVPRTKEEKEMDKKERLRLEVMLL
jgi:ATP-dependent RNA helicase DHX37/DHR1